MQLSHNRYQVMIILKKATYPAQVKGCRPENRSKWVNTIQLTGWKPDRERKHHN